MDMSFITSLDLSSFTTGCVVGVVVTLAVKITISRVSSSRSVNRVTQRDIRARGDVVGGNKSS